MKYVLFTLLFINLCSAGFSQFSTESNFNVVATARNQSILINYNFNKLQLGCGLKYSFNKLVNFPQNVFYKRTFYAITPAEHWGGEFNLKYQFLTLKDIINFSGFYNAQYTKSHIRFEGHFAIGQLTENPTSELDYIYIKHIDHIGPVLALENNLGVAIDISLFNGVYLSQKFGLGLMIFKNLEENTTIIGSGNWVFSEMLSFGIGYRLGLQTKKSS